MDSFDIDKASDSGAEGRGNRYDDIDEGKASESVASASASESTLSKVVRFEVASVSDLGDERRGEGHDDGKGRVNGKGQDGRWVKPRRQGGGERKRRARTPKTNNGMELRTIGSQWEVCA